MIAPVNGIEIAYDRTGSGDPVLLVMGLGFARVGWLPQIADLKRQFDVVSYDNRGVGETRSLGGFSMDDLVADAAGLIEFFGWSSVHVVGISMGGMISMELASRHRSLVRSLTLIATQGGGPRQTLPDLSIYSAFGEDVDPAVRLQKGIEITFGEKFRAEKPDVVRSLVSSIPARSGEGGKGFFRQALAVGRWSNAGGVCERLPLLQVPTLVLHGEVDQLIPCDNGRLIASRIPGATLHTFPDAGHALNVERMDEVNELVIDFLHAQRIGNAPDDAGNVRDPKRAVGSEG